MQASIHLSNPRSIKFLSFTRLSHLPKVPMFFLNSLIIVQLMLGKLFSEIPDFVFDPGGIGFMSPHLVFESFYSANVQFYIYMFIAFGSFIFFANKLVEGRDKNLILGTIMTHIIFFLFF
jgi:hypothetical protein